MVFRLGLKEQVGIHLQDLQVVGHRLLECLDSVIGSRCYRSRFSDWYYHLSQMLGAAETGFAGSLLLELDWLNVQCSGCSVPNMERARQTILFPAWHRYVSRWGAASELRASSWLSQVHLLTV